MFMPDVISFPEKVLWGLSGFSCLTLLKRDQDCVGKVDGGGGSAGLYLGVSFHKRFATLC